ncbi:L-histidine N(alpha)-methyltransferase [Nocardia jinanensis]|uniref:Histidine N-alpha-methyltransferase n=1 Tax=Nocardia jinanensis TaxID=382504 RepID=A0A917RRB4_9NOCA|nr:L-histidine N(alpha)-methyltransferase [Nocardia jinanensis]GGL20995.1 histidine N-alpha-methyltransferase [Nocardia jinanensis]
MAIAPTFDIQLTEADFREQLRTDVLWGLSGRRKWLPPKWFYDARGSKLFDLMAGLPEYYPTRTERALLRVSVDEIARRASSATELVELGSRSSVKTRLLLNALTTHGSLCSYIPQDTSENGLRAAADWTSREFPHLSVHGIVGDFTTVHPALPHGGRRLVALLGGALGNLPPFERTAFLGELHQALRPGEQLLVGVGLVTDPAVMIPAYDDAAGVTAEFNRNVLHVVNDRLGADFDPIEFAHMAVWDPDLEWIEMRLAATKPMRVTIPDLDLVVDFAAGEQMRTEISAKFRLPAFRTELAAAGFRLRHAWTDPEHRFALVLADR